MCLPGRFSARVARLTTSSRLFNCQITQNDIRLMALFCIIKHDREGENPASNLANKAKEWRQETKDRRGGDNQIKGK
jgi:hypothetical protein